MTTKKRIEEIKNSNVGENVDKELEETIKEGDKMIEENDEEFKRILGV